jgi:pyruvate carboxylase
MGAWDVGPFANDDALDWVAELSSRKSVDLVGSALSKVSLTSASDYLEASECSIALAAAEVVAAALGKPVDGFPEELAAWTKQNAETLSKQSRPALEAIERIKRSSELKELWEESADFQKWMLTINSLTKRLSAFL